MAHLFRLSDKAWAAIDPHLPRRRPGQPRAVAFALTPDDVPDIHMAIPYCRRCPGPSATSRTRRTMR